MILFCIFLLASVRDSFCMKSSKDLEGYPQGFLSDCPGSTKPAFITKSSLKSLRFWVQGPGGALDSKKKPYNYYNMKELAQDPDVDFNKKTFLYVGGYMDSPTYPLSWGIGKVYKDLDYNVLHLDFNKFTVTYYPAAVRYMRPVGKNAAEMLVNLMQYGLDPKKLEIVGLSLGGQTMSFIAKNFRDITGRNISRLTGLDPSGPCFRNLGPDQRLDLSDADFVDVVATNIDGFGMAAPVGHVNFYVNGGEYQLGDVIFIPCDVFCSHVRAYTLWLSAILHPVGFIGVKCTSVQEARQRNCYDNDPQVTNIMGLGTNKSEVGVFYLATKNHYPYYVGEKGLRKEYDFITKKLKAYNEYDVVKLR